MCVCGVAWEGKYQRRAVVLREKAADELWTLTRQQIQHFCFTLDPGSLYKNKNN
jgi:hypothetical protein